MRLSEIEANVQTKLHAAAAFLLISILFTAVPLACAQQKPSAGDTERISEFVQQFYDWYVPASANATLIQMLATNQMRAMLAPELYQAMRSDSEAQAKNTSDIVGLDFDPILASQDPCDRYEVVMVKQESHVYKATIRGVGACEKYQQPDLVLDLVASRRSWTVVNIHYPAYGTDLLRLLEQLRKDRY